jgi:D-inositol-3-phosphate glycosyltransferase
MKIGLVTSYMFPHLGGIERIAENLFEGYRAAGVDVRWVASHEPPDAPREEGARLRVPCLNHVERVLGVPVPIWGRAGWRAVDTLARWADGLHVLECLYLSSAMAVAAARRHRTPVVVSQNIGFVAYRSGLIRGLEHLAYRTLGRWVLRRATHVVLATPTAEAYVRRLFPRPLPHAMAFPIGIDTRRFRPCSREERLAARAALGLAADRPVVLFAGRLVEKKGLPLVLETSARLPETLFLVAGDGPLRRRLEEAPPNVVWHRSVPAAEMTRYYAAADCVLLPSQGEGLPLVVQEAMASGLPVVVSSDEIYVDNLRSAGVCVVAARTAGEMAAAVRRVLDGAAGALGEAARRHAAAHWTLEAMIERYVSLFERLRADAGRAVRPLRA